MRILTAKSRKLHRHELENYLKGNAGGDDYTAKDVLDSIFGDGYENDAVFDDIVISVYLKARTKWYHRLNIVWVMPFVTIMNMFQWVVSGNVGMKGKNKFSAWLLYICGYMK